MNIGGLFFVLLVAAIGYITAWYVVARVIKRADIIDTAWGLGFVYLSWLAWRLWGSPTGVPLLVVLFVSVWGLRLSTHIFLRNVHKPEDHRYVAYRKKWKDLFWFHTYNRIFLVQGLLTFAISLTAFAGITGGQKSFVPGIFLGFLLWAVGIGYESVADYQLKQFVKTKKPGEIMQSGLWRNSRHPNYFGELTSWWGAAVVGVSVGQWWAIIGAGVITLLITKISGVPLLEKHYADNPAFQKYAKHTSILIPLPKR